MTDKQADNAIAHDTLTPTERDFLQLLPEQYRRGAFRAYKDYRKAKKFSSVFERAKMLTAWMEGFVTAVYMVQREEDGKDVTPVIPGN